jgi:hypothetical protein
MSKIVDFYKKAKDDPKITADIEAVKKKYADAFTADLIEVAKKYGVTLVPEDFEIKKGELSEDDLAVIAGGYHISDLPRSTDIPSVNPHTRDYFPIFGNPKHRAPETLLP